MAHFRFSIPALAAPLAALAVLAGTPGEAAAHYIPAPCDFVTGGGYVFKDNGQRVNFGVHGGCKNGEFWGHVNIVDHETNYHITSTQITGYLWDPAFPNARDICGWAVTNDDERVMFRVRMWDNGEPGTQDRFGYQLDNWNHGSGPRFSGVSTRQLGNGQNGGGNIQLHGGNRSNTAPSPLNEFQMCGDLSAQ